MLRVLFVCKGNICRSPTAEYVFREFARARNLDGAFIVSSAGTEDWNVGKPANKTAVQVAFERGYDLEAHRAIQVTSEMLMAADRVFVMDESNSQQLYTMFPELRGSVKLELLGAVNGAGQSNIADPYKQSTLEFQEVLSKIEAACSELLRQLTGSDELKVEE